MRAAIALDMDEAAFVATLTRVMGGLNRAGVPFALAGGAAVYAHGGPHSRHDIDVLVEPGEADRAAEALARTGMSRAQPPEDWLLKVYDGDVLVDLIHHVADGRAVTADSIAAAPLLRVASLSARVISATELMAQKLRVLDCHRCDFAELLLIAKILREKVDWPDLRWRTRTSPFAQAFFQLLSGLAVIAPGQAYARPARSAPGAGDISPEYLVAGVRRALAEDPQVAELGIDIEIDQDSMRLVGGVNCQQQRAQVESTVRRIVEPLPIVNDIEVVQLSEPVERVAQ